MMPALDRDKTGRAPQRQPVVAVVSESLIRRAEGTLRTLAVLRRVDAAIESQAENVVIVSVRHTFRGPLAPGYCDVFNLSGNIRFFL
jgi:hypothetical protein